MSQKQLTNIFKTFTRGLSYSLGCPAVFSIAFCGFQADPSKVVMC